MERSSNSHWYWFVLAWLLIVVVVFLLFKYGSDDKQVIRDQFASIEQSLVKNKAEQPLESLAKSRELAEFFQDPCLFTIESTRYAGPISRRELIQKINGTRRLYVHGELKFYDLSIDLHENNTALVTFTMRLQGRLKDTDFRDIREIEASMHKIDGTWRFTSIHATDVLQR